MSDNPYAAPQSDVERATTGGELASRGKRMLPITVAANIPILGRLVGLVDALMIFRSDRRCGHDLIAGTIVVEYNG